MFCMLPSGGMLKYHNPRLELQVRNGREEVAIFFDGWNSDSSKGKIGWVRKNTYGGSLTESVCQATARDVQAFSLVNLHNRGYLPVLQTHDEIASEVPEGWGSVEEFEAIMSTMPPWAKGWPIKARGGWRGKRYRKD